MQALAQLCDQRGGRYTLETNPADYRNLNRAQQANGLSCYSFRHAIGSDLKTDIESGKARPEQAAKLMGYRSTESLAYYGTQSRGRGGKRPRAIASEPVKKVVVTRTAKAQARAKAALMREKLSSLRVHI